MAHRFFDYTSLSPAERIELTMELWDCLPDNSAEPPLAEWHRVELESRLNEYRNNLQEGESWEVVRERIKGNGEV